MTPQQWARIGELLTLMSRQPRVGDLVAPKEGPPSPKAYAEVRWVSADGKQLELVCPGKDDWDGSLVDTAEWQVLPGATLRRLNRLLEP
jgi:hypothetical protein